MDSEQLTSLSYIVKYMKLQVFDGKKTVRQAVEDVYRRIEEKGSGEGGSIPGNLAMPRRQELYAALNRCRTLVQVE